MIWLAILLALVRCHPAATAAAAVPPSALQSPAAAASTPQLGKAVRMRCNVHNTQRVSLGWPELRIFPQATAGVARFTAASTLHGKQPRL